MASSNSSTPGPAAPEQNAAQDVPRDTITLHVLSPCPEVNGGRITFPCIQLDTKISELKSRIQNSIVGSAPPARQRLIYLGRPLLNMENTLRRILQPEPNSSTDQNPTYTFHLVITPVPGSTSVAPTPTSQSHARQQTSTPPPGFQPQPHSAIHHHHHNHQPHVHLPPHAAMAQAQAAQAMLQHQLNQLQQQIAMTSMMGQAQGQAHGQGQSQGQRPTPNQTPHMHPFPPGAPNMQAFQAVIMQQQQMRAHAGMHGASNPAMNGVPNGVPSGMPLGQNPPGQIGPITTRVHETVGPDGQRTRVVVNETTFQISRQSTPVPTTDHAQVPAGAERSNQPLATSGLHSPPTRPQTRLQHDPLFPPPSLHVDEPRGRSPHIHGFEPPIPTHQYQQPAPNARQETTSSSTTVWLLSSSNGPQALVFAPGHGLFTNTPPTIQSSTRISRPHNSLRFQQSPNGRIRPQNPPNVPAPPALNPAAGNPLQPALDAIARARNAAPPAQRPNANADANNELLHTIMSRAWTFIKLYFVIFMFTEAGTWFRWLCLFAAALISTMPSTTVFRGFAARLQAHIDALVPPVVAPVARRQPAVAGGEGQAQRQDGPAAATTANDGAARRQGEPDPAETAARLVQEHRQRHPSVLRDGFEWAERALGLFVASLIPGVGERHVRAREEARREAERLELENERERAATATATEEEKNSNGIKDEEGNHVDRAGGEVAQSSVDKERKEHMDEAGSASTEAGAKNKANDEADETSVS